MIRLALATAAAVVLSACGNLCDRIESQNTSFETKHKACGTPPQDFNKTTCNESLSKCTAADQEKINKYLDCAEKIAACTQDKVLAFSESLGNCVTSSGISSVSAGCANAP
ncbi:MAG: hypothetical protein FJ086_11270 [Deltaproteobacteria bacterium]|nr:hypothetical protein [Deltaproteobacteria bacterium]